MSHRPRRRPYVAPGLGIPAHQVPPATGDYHWVYLWDGPIRAMHWLAALSIVVLAVTGFYIGKPYFVTVGRGRATHFLMGWMRSLHFGAAARARGHGDRAGLLAVRREQVRAAGRRCSRSARATGSTCCGRSSTT